MSTSIAPPVLRTAVFALFSICAAAASAESLANVLSSEGYWQARAQRRFGNHLFIASTMNGHRAALLIDTSAPATVIHRASAATFGLATAGTALVRRGVFGEVMNEYGRASLRDLRIGDRTLGAVPVVIADQAARVDPPEFLPIAKLK